MAAGGKSLARYIADHAPGNVVLIGYSMGGLIARDLIVNNYNGVLNDHAVAGLITLGTPNWGYPYLPLDRDIYCPQIVLDMAGSWNPDNNIPNEPSWFLKTLSQSWNATFYSGYWMAAAGTYCQSNPSRSPNLTGVNTGCPWNAPHSYNDGVVCSDSAAYSDFIPLVTPFSRGPDTRWTDPSHQYVHTTSWWGLGTGAIFCPSVPGTFQLFQPPLIGELYNQIVQVLNGH